MRTKTIAVPDWAHPLLRNAEIEGNALRLREQLVPADYVEIKKVLEGLGGKWNKKAKAILFAEDPREIIAKALGDGSVKVESIMNKQQTFGQFFTPMFLAAQMVNMAEIKPGHRVLEPSAGDGRLLMHMPHEADIAAVEIDPELAAKLTTDFPWVSVHCKDFLQTHATPFDRIVMNPPFSMGVDVKHILWARALLAPGGRLVAICGGGPNSESRLRAQAIKFEILPENTFKESGTGVRSALLVMEAE